MKNTFTDPLFVNNWFTKHHIKALIMRVSQVSILIMTSAILTMAAPKGNGQSIESTTVDVAFKNESLKEVFREIERQTEFLFSWDEGIEKSFREVSLEEGRYTVREVLDFVLEGTELEYKQSNNYMIVLPLEKNGGPGEKTGVEKVDQPEMPSSLVTGTVKNASTQETLAGVNIIVKGTTKGTTTDAEGRYAIDLEDNDLLVFSFVGYESFETHVGGRSVIDVEMQEDVAALQEVIVNGGYYTVSKDRATMNIAKVTAKDIERQPVTSPLVALQGRVPGLDITPNNGAPGSSLKVQIRGLNSLRSDGNYPLYVVDGVPVDSRPIGSFSNASYSSGFDPLSTINPSNIASVEVLKDAGATAIYGSRGANGVILITTKSPDTNGGTHLDVNMYTGWGRLPKKVDLLNTRQYIEMRKEALVNDNEQGFIDGPFAKFSYPDLLVWDTTRYTDWQEVLLGKTSRISDTQIGFSGGNANTSFRMGGEFYKESTITQGDFGFTRLNGSVNLNHTSLSKRFKADAAIMYGASKNRHGNESFVVGNSLTLPPNAPTLYNEDGTLNWELVPFGANYFTTWTNPLSILRKLHESTSTNLVANGKLANEIVNGITLTTNLGYTALKNEEIMKSPIASMSPTLSNATASVTFGYHNRNSWIVEPQVTFVKSIADHIINVVTGATWQGNRSSYLTIHGNGYTSDVFLNSIQGAPTKEIRADYISEYYYMAFFSHIGYAWKGKYLLDLAGRRDGSSRFGPGKRFGSFGAASVAWIFTSESFIKNNIPWLSFGKVRSSYGITGNDQIGDYQFLDTYGFAASPYQNTVSLVPYGLSNPELAWEVTKKFEIGAELRFLQDRIAVEASRYVNRSSNQLINYALPATTGFTEFPTNFKGATVENSGWEFVLGGHPISSKGLSWNISINLSIPKNKLAEFDGIDNSPYVARYKVGAPLTIQRQFLSSGVNPQTGLYEMKDLDGNGVINSADRTFTSWYGRKFYGGISNTFSYRNFDVSFLFQFSDFTGSGLGVTLADNLPGLNLNQPAYVLDRWRQEGDVTSVAKFSQSISNRSLYLRFIRESDLQVNTLQFIRLKTLSISYQLPAELCRRTRAQEWRVYLQGQNLFVSGDVPGFDPETGISLPPLRMFTAGIQIKF